MNFLQLKINNKIKNKFNGFTLVETLVAISILLMAVVAPLVLIAGNISSAFSVKDKIIALYLAEDAVDFVKYKIDTNFNEGDANWLDGVDACVAGGGQPCRVDSFNDTVQICGGPCPVINFYSTTGVYEYILGSPSKFRRTITIVPVTQDPNPSTLDPDEVIITALVEWEYKGVTKQTEISEHAFSWGI